MIRFLTTSLLFIFITNCSFDKRSGFWTKDKKVEREQQNIIKVLFEDERTLENEFNPGLKINLKAKLINNSFINNIDNNNGRINYNGNLKSVSRFKFSKIDNFDQFEPEIIFSNNNVIFFNN